MVDKVLVPFLQSVIPGLFVAILVAPWVEAGYAVTIGALVALAVWFATAWPRGETPRKSLYVSPAAPVTVKVELVENNGNTTRFIELPASEKQLAQLAAGLAKGKPFAEEHWTGSGRPFSVGQFRALRDEMLRRGLVVWNSPDARNQGLTLTASGRAIIKRLGGER